MNKGTIKRAATKLGIIDNLTIDMDYASYTVRHNGGRFNDNEKQHMTADMVWEAKDAATADLQALSNVIGGTINRQQLCIAR